MNKVVRDGLVGVIVSPGYGAGWSTWIPDNPDILFDGVVIDWILNGKRADQESQLEAYLESEYPDGYFSLGQLEVVWLPEGTQFRIDEYDGSETLVLASDQRWLTA
jgi:hypothetical protein